MSTMNIGDQQSVSNIRGRWPDLAKKYTDEQLAKLYYEFSMSEEHGDNDAKFPDWLKDEWADSAWARMGR